MGRRPPATVSLPPRLPNIPFRVRKLSSGRLSGNIGGVIIAGLRCTQIIDTGNVNRQTIGDFLILVNVMYLSKEKARSSGACLTDDLRDAISSMAMTKPIACNKDAAARSADVLKIVQARVSDFIRLV